MMEVAPKEAKRLISLSQSGKMKYEYTSVIVSAGSRDSGLDSYLEDGWEPVRESGAGCRSYAYFLCILRREKKEDE